MRNRQLWVLFLANMIPLVIGMGLFPILPLYAARFGATHTLVGLLYATTYAASVAGITLTGWLSARVPQRALFIAGGLLGIPAVALLAVATALWQVMVLTGLIWFAGGVTITLINLFTAQIAEGGQRGASFSLLYMSSPLSAVIGGVIVSQFVAGPGYGPMFLVLAVVWCGLPLLALGPARSAFGAVGLRDPKPASALPTAEAHHSASPLGWGFQRLLLSALLAALAINVGRLGTSLSMEALGFDAGVIESTAIVSGLIAAPVSLLLGLLSERLSQRTMLLSSYGLAVAGALVLLGATTLWQFWLAATLLLVAWCVNRSMNAALATDTLAPTDHSRGLPLLNTMDSLASIVGFAGAGYLLDTLGPVDLYLGAAGLAVLCVPLLITLPRRANPVPAT